MKGAIIILLTLFLVLSILVLIRQQQVAGKGGKTEILRDIPESSLPLIESTDLSTLLLLD